MVRSQLRCLETSPNHGYRDGIFLQNRIVKSAMSHLTRVNQLPTQGPELKSSKHVGSLIERAVATLNRTPDLSRGVARLMAHFSNKELDGLLGAHGS